MHRRQNFREIKIIDIQPTFPIRFLHKCYFCKEKKQLFWCWLQNIDRHRTKKIAICSKCAFTNSEYEDRNFIYWTIAFYRMQEVQKYHLRKLSILVSREPTDLNRMLYLIVKKGIYLNRMHGILTNLYNNKNINQKDQNLLDNIVEMLAVVWHIGKDNTVFRPKPKKSKAIQFIYVDDWLKYNHEYYN